MSSIAAYILVHDLTGKFYVGSSKDYKKRVMRHRADLTNGSHHCRPFQEIWNFDCGITVYLHRTATREEAYEVEQQLLHAHRNNPLLLNVGLGVQGGDNLTKNPLREEIIQKMTDALAIRYSEMTDEERSRVYGRAGSLNGMWGKTHTPETREKLSLLHKTPDVATRLASYKQTDGYKQALSKVASLRVGDKNPFYGKSHSDDTRRKIAASKLGTIPTNVKPVYVDGIRYESVTEAARNLKVGPAVIVYRLRSKSAKFAGYNYIEETFND